MRTRGRGRSETVKGGESKSAVEIGVEGLSLALGVLLAFLGNHS